MTIPPARRGFAILVTLHRDLAWTAKSASDRRKCLDHQVMAIGLDGNMGVIPLEAKEVSELVRHDRQQIEAIGCRIGGGEECQVRNAESNSSFAVGVESTNHPKPAASLSIQISLVAR